MKCHVFGVSTEETKNVYDERRKRLKRNMTGVANIHDHLERVLSRKIYYAYYKELVNVSEKAYLHFITRTFHLTSS